MKKILLILLTLNAIFLCLGLNISQENPEELFLSDDNRQEFESFHRMFGAQDLVFISQVDQASIPGIMAFAEENDTEFASLEPLIPNSGIVIVPKVSDTEKYHFFERMEQRFSRLKFAGESFTNAHLAGMSIKIQKILFPIVFLLIFLGLILLINNLAVSLYLFLSSLLGVGIGLTTLKFIYSHSTILTSLTPLISFVLTLGVQLHVVYGLSFYNDKSIFFKKKIKPLLIMMITTLIGFLSLITSDLQAIRQLAVTATLSLTITWGILIILVRYIPFSVKLAAPNIVAHNLKRPSYQPLLGWSILILLVLGGTTGLSQMPVVVEAIKFFSIEHKVQQGFNQLKQKMGGTPQFELVITRKDGRALDFEDLKHFVNYENKLASAFPNVKFISINNLVKIINGKYTGVESLPDNIYAYQLLQSKIPNMLSKNQLTETAYRLSYISDLLEPSERLEIKYHLDKSASMLGEAYSLKITGMTHLLLQSQIYLVHSLIKSFFLSFSMIVFIFTLFSRTFKEILTFAALNFASILGGIFLLWLIGMNLNVSSIMTVSVSMGLVVDSTVHLLYANREKTERNELQTTTLAPIVVSHILLFGAFMSLTPESFVPIRDFSLGLVILLFIGLLCDLFILPLISKSNQV